MSLLATTLTRAPNVPCLASTHFQCPSHRTSQLESLPRETRLNFWSCAELYFQSHALVQFILPHWPMCASDKNKLPATMNIRLDTNISFTDKISCPTRTSCLQTRTSCLETKTFCLQTRTYFLQTGQVAYRQEYLAYRQEHVAYKQEHLPTDGNWSEFITGKNNYGD